MMVDLDGRALGAKRRNDCVARGGYVERFVAADGRGTIRFGRNVKPADELAKAGER